MNSFGEGRSKLANLFIESLPAKAEFEALLGPLGLKAAACRDVSMLYLMVAEKIV